MNATPLSAMPGLSGAGLTGLVATIYEAACDPTRIVPFVEDAAAYFGAQRAAFFVWPVNNPAVFLPVTYGIKGRELQRLFNQRNEPGSLFWELSKRRLGSTFFAEAQLSSGRTARVLAGLIDAGEENRCGLLLFRDADHDAFSQSVREALQTLIDYFARSLTINKRFVRMFAQNQTAFSLLECVPIGIAICGQRGQFTFRNAEARRIFSDSETFIVDDDNLHLSDAEEHDRLYEFLERARDSYEIDFGEQSLSMRLKRTNGLPAYQLLAYALPFRRTQAAFDVQQSLAVLIIHDPSHPKPLREEMLRDFFGFTSAEARLARHLHSGRSLNDAAAELKISVHTARTQLRSMFKKTGVGTQAGLMQEFCNSPQLNIGS